MEKPTLGLAEKLGLSVTRIGESIIVEGAKQLGKGIKGMGEGIEKIFNIVRGASLLFRQAPRF